MVDETLRDCFLEASVRCGQKRAITFLRKRNIETQISYRDLDRDANRLANTFLKAGVQRGDMVVFFMEKSL